MPDLRSGVPSAHPFGDQLCTGDTPEARALAYGDVLAAWQDYLVNYNDGRGVVFIGHSQGTFMLTNLIATEIDPDPELRGLLVSALLIGGNVRVAAGQDAGGDFQNIPPAAPPIRQAALWRTPASTGNHRPTPPLEERTRPARAGGRRRGSAGAVCEPASLSGGTGELEAYFGTAKFPGPIGWFCQHPVSAHPWVASPGLYTAECKSSGGASWLQVDTTGIAGDTRQVVYATLGPDGGCTCSTSTLRSATWSSSFASRRSPSQADPSPPPVRRLGPFPRDELCHGLGAAVPSIAPRSGAASPARRTSPPARRGAAGKPGPWARS